MVRKRVVRVLVYDGSEEWVDNTFHKNAVKGVFATSLFSITETVVSTVTYATVVKNKVETEGDDDAAE